MLPSEVLAKLLDVDPRNGKFLLVGLACVAAGAIVASWGFSPDVLLAASYVLGFALVCSVVAFVATNPAMRRWLGWTLTASFTLYMVGLVDSAFQISGRLPAPPCYLRIFVETRESCEQRFAPVVEVIGGTENAALRTRGLLRLVGGPERLWLAQTDEPAYSGGPIYLQFGDPITRDQSARFAETLAENGWPVEGAEEGGEWVKAVPDRNEVRYFDPAHRDDAVRLAHAIHALIPESEIAVRDFSRLAGKVSAGHLEIWLIDLGRNS
ncbi:hypothetical protein DEA8626_00357 [Defluviimonas aquaemixtae]|uniref:Uncharacterized protein n=1 Tax=Albidovulum aquaemixtae TaxID=1542388 RepID=A0A2R8B2U7_9RHOB|nr:hypothetical protein [Defluviimonas aquaemixtae]SPH16843.1 hypothetical protein DEA8626_00357 [Defluviimonas aquaemixtae]